MGLAIEVGFLADLKQNDLEGYQVFKDQFSLISSCLDELGLPEHVEPENCEVWSCEMYGYSGLHYLRRLAAYIDAGNKLPPPGDSSASKDPVLRQYYRLADKVEYGLFGNLRKKLGRVHLGFNHLIMHSDCDGYYLPIEFENVIRPEKSQDIFGEFIGSSHKLLSECKQLAFLLQIPEKFDENSEELFIAADYQGEGDSLWEKFGVEAFTCVRLMRACEKSIENKAAIVYC